jgi:hypothetical protein
MNSSKAIRWGGASCGAFAPPSATHTPKRRERRPTILKITDANNFRHTVVGLCLIAGPLVTLIGGLVTKWEENDTKAAYLRSLAENPTRAQISAVLFYFGFLLTAVGTFGILHLLRHRAVVLGHVAGVLAPSSSPWLPSSPQERVRPKVDQPARGRSVVTGPRSVRRRRADAVLGAHPDRGVASLMVRFRRSGSEERMQLKWFVYGVSTVQFGSWSTGRSKTQRRSCSWS